MLHDVNLLLIESVDPSRFRVSSCSYCTCYTNRGTQRALARVVIEFQIFRFSLAFIIHAHKVLKLLAAPRKDHVFLLE